MPTRIASRQPKWCILKNHKARMLAHRKNQPLNPLMSLLLKSPLIWTKRRRMLKMMKRTAWAPLTQTVSNLNLSRMIMMRILMKRAMMKRPMKKRAIKKRAMKKRAMMKMEKKARWLKMANFIALRIWKRIKKKKSSKKIIRRSHQRLNQIHLWTFETAQNQNSRRMRMRGWSMSTPKTHNQKSIIEAKSSWESNKLRKWGSKEKTGGR